jgi:hypothetical protein
MMTNNTKLALINTKCPAVAIAIAKLPAAEQDAILTTGGKVTLASGIAPNGMHCTLIATVARDLSATVVAVAPDGREQPIGHGHVDAIIAKLGE